MNKGELISMITNKLSGGTLTPDLKSKYHPELIAMVIGRAFNQVLRDTITRSSEFDIYARTYKNVEVFHDLDTDTYYSSLPQDTIQLQNKQQIRRIALMKEKSGLSFKPLDIGAEEVYGGLEASMISTVIGFTLIGNRVEYAWFPKSTDLKVRMDIVIPFERYEYTDEVHIPTGKDAQFLQLIDYHFQQLRPTDTISDNNPKQVV